jgi:hypothetical protein
MRDDALAQPSVRPSTHHRITKPSLGRVNLETKPWVGSHCHLFLQLTLSCGIRTRFFPRYLDLFDGAFGKAGAPESLQQ